MTSKKPDCGRTCDCENDEEIIIWVGKDGSEELNYAAFTKRINATVNDLVNPPNPIWLRLLMVTIGITISAIMIVLIVVAANWVDTFPEPLRTWGIGIIFTASLLGFVWHLWKATK